ncbi:hypothetical protein BKI52_04405 [marine bacterium AO1-C]|nr:hypothetical protein BKI52_04405 [marine bacterium AO1-C]
MQHLYHYFMLQKPIKTSLLIVGLFLVLHLPALGQRLSLNELHYIANQKNWSAVNQYLIKRGWEYYESAKGSSTKYNTISWSYNKSYDDRAEGWFHLYTYEGLPNKVEYSIFNKPSYLLIQNSLLGQGYRLKNKDIENNEIVTAYANARFILKIATQKRNKSSSLYNKSIVEYRFLLIKKAGVYDDDNGKKIEYYADRTKKAEYTLKDGKIHGEVKLYHPNGHLQKKTHFYMDQAKGLTIEYNKKGQKVFEYTIVNKLIQGKIKTFHPNGQIRKQGTFKDGKQQGKFIEFDEAGNKTAEYTMKASQRHGKLVAYEKGKKTEVLYYEDGLKHGSYQSYYYDDKSDKLQLRQSGSYQQGKKDGNWQFHYIEEKYDKERLLSSITYAKGIRDGAFQQATGDSLIIGTYRNDLLQGSYKIYRDERKLLLGGVIRTDTSSLKIIADGAYNQGRKSGYWKMYDIFGVLRATGSYKQGKKTSTWKYYYTNYVDKNNKLRPYSGKLYLLENYQNGKKDGKVESYSNLVDKNVPCSEIDPNKNPLDTCTKKVFVKKLITGYYKNGQPHGPYTYRDSLNEIVHKGMFRNGLKEGKWFHRYTQKGTKRDFYVYTEGNYLGGKEEGLWARSYKKGIVAESFHYKNGKYHGEFISWRGKDKFQEKKTFDNDRLTSLVTYDSLTNQPKQRYEIYDETANSYKCRWTTYGPKGQVSQEYWVKKDQELNHYFFDIFFVAAISSQGKNGYKDGLFKYVNSEGKLLEEGRYHKKDKVGIWHSYFYDQGVVLEEKFDNGQQTMEKHLLLNDELFSGKFTFTNQETGIREIRKVKDGVRHGKTRYVDIKTGKTIKKESYKNGTLKK